MPTEEQTYEEVMKEAEAETKTILPEAPVSITVKGYYKGFSVMITKRNGEGIADVDKIVTAVENMISKGFKPSWNEDTNGKTLPKETPVNTEPAKQDLPVCPIHMKLMKERTSSDGRKFYSHSQQAEDGAWEYCSGRGYKQ